VEPDTDVGVRRDDQERHREAADVPATSFSGTGMNERSGRCGVCWRGWSGINASHGHFTCDGTPAPRPN